jgi:hypothetical protein
MDESQLHDALKLIAFKKFRSQAQEGPEPLQRLIHHEIQSSLTIS